MKVEQQVVCLKLSQELKEAGYKQEGLWWWNKYSSNDFQNKDNAFLANERDEANGSFVAPTVAELGEALKDPSQEILSFYKILPVWTGTEYAVYKNGKYLFSKITEADARAVVWLKENLL